MHKASIHPQEQIHDAGRWHQLTNAVKRNLAPLAIAAAGVLTVSVALNADEAAAMQRSHPVFPLRNYDQGDYSERMARFGCGPDSMAMVVATEANDSSITPPVIGKQLSPEYWIPGSGTLAAGFHHISKRYGVQSEHANKHESKDVLVGLQKAKDILWDGGLAIIHADPGHFTSAGHYMVLKAVRSDGRFKIADPNGAPGRDSEVRWWSPRELKHAGVDDVWTFTPSENMLMHTENMAGHLATGDIQIQPDSHEFDLPR
jgi:hypothetical protein